MTLLYMPFTIVASSAGEWIFGTTDYTRDILCQIHGFVLAYSVIVSGQTLAVISVDRFLYIVKSNVYFKIMTWKAGFALMAIIWVSSPLLTYYYKTPYCLLLKSIILNRS